MENKDKIKLIKKALKSAAFASSLSLFITGCKNNTNNVETTVPSETEETVETTYVPEIPTIIRYKENDDKLVCSSIDEIKSKDDIKEIEVLYLNNVKDISEIDKIESLECIKIIKPTTNTLEGLDFDKFKKVVIYDASFNDWSFLNECSSLEELSITNTNLKDVSFLNETPNLTYLNLSCNFITEFGDYNLNSLKHLNLNNNSVKKFNIEKYPSLVYVNLAGNYNLFTRDLLDYINNSGTIDCFSTNYRTIELTDINYVNRVKNDLKGLGLSDTDKLGNEIKICDFVMKYLDFDSKSKAAFNSKEGEELHVALQMQEALYSSEPLYSYNVKQGTSFSYAETLDMHLELAGINSFLISTKLADIGNHSFNIVEIDGNYMVCDLSFEDNKEMYSNYIDSENPNYINLMGDEIDKIYSNQVEVHGFYNEDIDLVTVEDDNYYISNNRAYSAKAVNQDELKKKISESNNKEYNLSLNVVTSGNESIVLLNSKKKNLTLNNDNGYDYSDFNKINKKL